MMAFKGEVSARDEMDFGIGQVTLESIGSGWDERRIVLSPDSQQRGLVVAQVLLELWIKSNIRTVVEDEVVLHLSTAWQVHIIVIKAVPIGTYATFGRTEGVLANDCFKGEGR